MREAILLLSLLLAGTGARGQRPVTLTEVEAAALTRNLRMHVAEADVAAALADALTARAWPPLFASFTYTGDTPQYHALVELNVENPWLRASRIRAAEAAHRAAQHRLAFQREEIRIEVDSVYSRAALAQELARLSAEDRRIGEELVRIARERRDRKVAGALELEIVLLSQAAVTNQAHLDSVEAEVALLEVQGILGIPGSRVVVSLEDSLAALAFRTVTAEPTPLLLAAMEADLLVLRAKLSQERATVFTGALLKGGVDWHDRDTGSNRKLPVLGISLPLPLFDRNRGPIAAARAEAERDLARDETAGEAAAADRALTEAGLRIERSRPMRDHAGRVVRMSLAAYREETAPLTTVLEARRLARDALRQYVQDLAALAEARVAMARARTGRLPE